MRKILLGLVAAAAIASPLAATTAASAAVSTAPTCTPSAAVAKVDETSHTEYKWAALVAKGGLHWETKWTTSTKNPSTDLKHIWVKALDLSKKSAPQITKSVVDTAAVTAKDAVTCEIALPANPLTGLTGIGPNTVVPTPAGTDQYTFSAVTNHVALNGKIGTTVTAKPGYVFPGGLTSKVFAATPDNSGFVFYSQIVGKHVNLPDVFDIEHAGEFPEGTYWATKVSLTIVNDTNTAQEFRIRYVDVQDSDRVWVQGTRFTDGMPNNVVAANSSRPFEVEVWHNVVSGADVPNDLTLDFGFELA